MLLVILAILLFIHVVLLITLFVILDGGFSVTLISIFSKKKNMQLKSLSSVLDL